MPELIEKVKNPPTKIGEECMFIDSLTLSNLGYVREFLLYAETKWKVISITPSWRPVDQGFIQFYFDLINEDEIIVSSIPDEILIRVI